MPTQFLRAPEARALTNTNYNLLNVLEAIRLAAISGASVLSYMQITKEAIKALEVLGYQVEDDYLSYASYTIKW